MRKWREGALAVNGVAWRQLCTSSQGQSAKARVEPLRLRAGPPDRPRWEAACRRWTATNLLQRWEFPKLRRAPHLEV